MLSNVEYTRLMEILLRQDNYIILLHQNADPDAVGSGIALKELLKSQGKNVIIGTETLNNLSKNLLSNLGDFIVTAPTDHKNLIILDTSTPVQLGAFEKMLDKAEVIISIDHHETFETSKFKGKKYTYFINKERTSTAEIIFDIMLKMREEGLLKKDSINCDKLIRGILTGIVTDTGHMRFSDVNTLKTLIHIFKRGYHISDVDEILKIEDDISKRIAILKAHQRMKIYSVSEFIVATSNVSSCEALSAKAILSTGADVAFVGADNGSEVRISGRAKKSVIDRGINLAKIMSQVAPIIDGEGGGHKGAAGANGKRNMEEGLKKCVEFFVQDLGGQSNGGSVEYTEETEIQDCWGT
ncbi:MAG: DHH family phosphoesterase [Candidatus Methanofastidiosum sp.]|nr:DHH family phosphoesterase [Methanofastidiosum sp.]